LIALLPDVVTYQADPTRLSNAIRYTSPVSNGLWVMAAYSTAPFSDDSISSTSKPERAASIGISYTSGRFGAYYSHQDVSNRALLPIAANIKDHALGVAYDFEVFKLMGVALTTRRDGTTTRRAIDLVTLGAIVPVSSNSMLRLDIGQLHDRTLANANATSWMVGYDYHLSKRTMLYLGYNTLTNQLNSAYAADTNNRPLPGSNAKLAGLGVRHNF
jgi:predicted porin